MAREAVIVQSLRTGLTKAHRGSFNITEPVDYLAHTLRESVASVPNLDPGEIEDVIVGTGFPEGCQGMNMARIAAMAAGFPKEVAGTTVNRFCSSGSQAVMMAAQSIISKGQSADRPTDLLLVVERTKPLGLPDLLLELRGKLGCKAIL